MNRRLTRLSGFYQHLLKLYPSGFQEDYLEEMATVFQLQLQAHGEISRWQAVRIAVKELLPLPGLLISAHLRERRQKQMRSSLNRWFSHPDPGSWTELVLASIPFVLMGILPGLFSLIPAIKDLPPRISIPILVLMALILISLGLVGLLANLPRWVLAYAGILLTLITFGGLLIGARISDSYNLFHFPPGWGRISATALLLAVFLVVHFLVTGILLWLLKKINLTAGFQHRVKSDPSLLAYMLYGGSFIIMLVNYDDISRGGSYYMLSSAVMILGAWGYFRSINYRSKIMALTAGISVATGLALIANLTLLDYPITLVEIRTISIPSPVIYVGLTWLTSIIMIVLLPLAFRSGPTSVKT